MRFTYLCLSFCHLLKLNFPDFLLYRDIVLRYNMRNYYPKRPSCAKLDTFSKSYDAPVGFVAAPSFDVVYCLICGRRRVAVARNRMICLVIVMLYKVTKFIDRRAGNVQGPIAKLQLM